MDRPRASRISSARILSDLRSAARRGDRSALTLALDQMRTLALSPRYWEKYLALLGNPLARLVDLLVIKQGERIAHQKGWKKVGAGKPLGRGLRPPSDAFPQDRRRGQSPRSKRRPPARRRNRRAASPPGEQLLFEL